GAALVLAALVLAATNLQLGLSNVNDIAKQGEAKQGLLAIERSGIGAGSLVPHEVLVRGSSSPEAVAHALAQVRGVSGAVAPAPPAACSTSYGSAAMARSRSGVSPPPARSPRGYRLWCSRSCSACRWTTRCSSSRACVRNTTPPDRQTPPSCEVSGAPAGLSRAPR